MVMVGLMYVVILSFFPQLILVNEHSLIPVLFMVYFYGAWLLDFCLDLMVRYRLFTKLCALIRDILVGLHLGLRIPKRKSPSDMYLEPSFQEQCDTWTPQDNPTEFTSSI